MFQTFTTSTTPEQGPPRLAALRAQMAILGIDAFVVPRADAHQGEYVAPCDARLQWLTGFTGSAGFAVVTADKAALFVDGRYRLQGRAQVAAEIAIVPSPETKLADWLAQNLPTGARVGFDPWLHTRDEVARLPGAVPVANPVDAVWDDRPPPPAGAVTPYPHALAGTSATDKRTSIANSLTAAGQAWAVLTLPDSLCWLLNIRGSDIPRIPIVQAFALIEAATGDVRLFVNSAKMGDVTLPGVTVLPPDSLLAALASLSGPVRVDPASAPWIVGDTLVSAGLDIAWEPDPCALPKARKSAAEIAATTQAHLRDGAAMCAFLHWLDARIDALPGTALTEIQIVTALEGFRRRTDALRDISFDTIAGSGPNGAIIHYRVTDATDRALQPGDLMLVDSGGQYQDGTTDITRTIPVGTPDAEQIAAYSRVLRGLIAISRARWPVGLAGRDLDALARAPLWMAGQDYDHGTGHGVGVYLSVHEGPQRLSKLSEVPLQPGMILSNEPGYYRDGAWGIRLENLIVVQHAPPLPGGDAHRAMLHFETLAWVPFDRRLIDAGQLSRDERAWLDAYHAGVRDRMASRVGDDVRDWLNRATAPL